MPVDFASVIRAGQSLVPDIREQMMLDDQRKLQQQAQALKLQQAQQAQAREGVFRQRVSEAINSNDPRAISRLMIEFPEFADQIKPGWEAMRDDERRINLTQTGSAYARAQAGDYKGAAAVLQKRYQADLQAGSADETTKELIDALNSDDPMMQQQAVGTLGMLIAADNPEKFAETYRAVNPTENKTNLQRQYDWLKQTKGQDYADRWLAVESDKFVPVDGVGIFRGSDLIGAPGPISGFGGGTYDMQGRQVTPDQRGGDPAISATGSAIESAALAAIPGLTVTSRQRSAGKNASVGGVKNSYHLTDQARDFVPPKGMSMGMLAKRLKDTMPGFDVINEGDHVHVEPSSRRQAASGGPVRVRSVQEARRLPSGTEFITPDGRRMRKP
ncbi:D-Ala-D-Ala carboxypeptidase family metallohydrolase [Novosphingobium sp. M1R2S20]|uniref:D-Ala-D-Ala carboxypeptidase family metallohydrolase n=1 Tax=Novosphingobium rhizovicinum TaxID=3228928 RepID=A0ABV3RCZ5_9SPHN